MGLSNYEWKVMGVVDGIIKNYNLHNAASLVEAEELMRIVTEIDSLLNEIIVNNIRIIKTFGASYGK